MSTLTLATAGDRTAAADFVGRVAQLDTTGLVRVFSHDGAVRLWAKAGFGVIATRAVAGTLQPSPITVYATDLIGALAVSRADEVDPGREAQQEWRAQLPPCDGWRQVGELPPGEIVEHVATGLVDARAAMEAEREHELSAATKATVPPRLLDSSLMSVGVGDELIPVSMRMLFALSGMGFVTADTDEAVTVRVTKTWLRLDIAAGSVARRRMANLPLA